MTKKQLKKKVSKKSEKKVTKKVSTDSSKKVRKISHAGARKKGLNFEVWVANQLAHIFPEAQRQLEYHASDCVGVDLRGLDRIKIQCKNHQNYVSVGTIKEIISKDKEDIPVLVTKGIRLDPMAVLPFEKLVTLLEIAYSYRLPFRTLDSEDNTTKLVPIESAVEGIPELLPPEDIPEASFKDIVGVVASNDSSADSFLDLI